MPRNTLADPDPNMPAEPADASVPPPLEPREAAANGRADVEERVDGAFLGGAGPDHSEPQSLAYKFANRHGLIAGATGTGKTVTLQVLAEAFSSVGTPVFLADVKGDLSGLAKAGSESHKLHDKLQARAETIGLDPYAYTAFPTVFWDLFGEQGHPVRATISDLGPLALTRLLGLNEAQEGALNVVFRAAQDDGLALYDLKDLRAMLAEVTKKASALSATYGRVSTASIGAIQRRLLILENQGAGAFFGEPGLTLDHLIARAPDGRGHINILAAERLMRSPRLYATFLFWLMKKLFEELPEVGDPDRPVMAFFFDEAHLLFDDAPKAFIDQVETVARLIRSKGVGVFFVTQNPRDIPDDILGQLGARVQHALRAFTPRDRRALRQAADTFRPNPAFDTADTIPQLGVGEALVSTLEDSGAPSQVARTLIRPPSSQIGPIDAATRLGVMRRSPYAGVFDEPLDRHSAFEALEAAAERAAEAALAAEEAEERARAREKEEREARRGDRVGRSRERRRARRSSRSKSSSSAEGLFGGLARRLGRGLVDGLVKRVFGRR